MNLTTRFAVGVFLIVGAVLGVVALASAIGAPAWAVHPAAGILIAVPLVLMFHGMAGVRIARILHAVTNSLAARRVTRAGVTPPPTVDDMVGAIEGLRRELEEEKQRSARHLRLVEREVEERTKHLDEARESALASSRAKSSLLTTLGHEIRNPITGVVGMTALLVDSKLDKEQHECVKSIRQSSDLLLTMISEILDYSRIEEGKLDIEKKTFNVWFCVEEAIELMAGKAAEKDLTLAYWIDDATPLGLIGDEVRVKQVLVNLLANAIKFTDKGGVDVSVLARRTSDKRFEVQFAVLDTGIGIPAERIEDVFRMNPGGANDATRRGPGLGLGLAISKRLAHLMGGNIRAESEVGAGSTFFFTVRAAEAQITVPTREASFDAVDFKDSHVLIVDENATTRRILVRKMQSWGMVPKIATTAAETLELLRAEGRFDFAIVDSHIARADGFALPRAIRDLDEQGAIPIIVMTAPGQSDWDHPKEKYALDAMLAKPLNFNVLRETVASILSRRGSIESGAEPLQIVDRNLALRHPLRILVAEDSTVNQKLVARILQKMGYNPDIVAHGAEAIEAVERETYDVILMDVQMPVMNGLEATRVICERQPLTARPRIVAMTANVLQSDRDDCLSAGMDDYLSKPLRVEELVGALQRCPARVGT